MKAPGAATILPLEHNGGEAGRSGAERGEAGRRATMASATSESYCNHLRGQLKEWERAFRSRNGRFPKQPDYEALEDDGSARGRLVHGAYTALNRATGDSFIKVGQRCLACGLLSVPPLVAEGFSGCQ